MRPLIRHGVVSLTMGASAGIARAAAGPRAERSSPHYFQICTVPSRQPMPASVGRRWTLSELERLRQEREGPSEPCHCFWLPMHLSGTVDLETWPEPLHYFPFKLPSEDAIFPETKSTAKVSKALRKYYPEDEVLLSFADFIDSANKADPDVKFSRKPTDDCPAGNQGDLE